MEGKKKGSSKPLPMQKGALKEGSSGTMDYMSKQESFQSKDSAKVRSNQYKDKRYGE